MNSENALIPNLITSFHFYNLDIKFKSFLFSGFLASSIAFNTNGQTSTYVKTLQI
jgi:hypothetical protein